jgi:hypothetical protein
MMNKILLFCCTLFIFQEVCSQVPMDTLKTGKDSTAAISSSPKVRKDNRPIKDRIDFGFGTSFWITPNQTYLELAPILAYRFPKTLITGMSYRYIYRHSRVYGRDLNAYGPSFFARLNLTRRIYAWTEYEILHNEYFTQVAGQEITTNNVTTDSWFAGLGYIRSFGKKGRGGLSFQLLYNFLYDRDIYSPYYAAVTYRIGYFF